MSLKRRYPLGIGNLIVLPIYLFMLTQFLKLESGFIFILIFTLAAIFTIVKLFSPIIFIYNDYIIVYSFFSKSVIKKDDILEFRPLLWEFSILKTSNKKFLISFDPIIVAGLMFTKFLRTRSITKVSYDYYKDVIMNKR